MEKLLLQRVKEGDPRAFEELYGQYSDYALRVAAVITRNSASAADAVQEAFIRVYHSIGSFDMERPFEPWFYKILVNECNRVLKKNGRILSLGEYGENHEKIAAEDDHKFVEYEELYDAIHKLHNHNRIPIVLKYLKGFQETEIAEILDLNLNTVKSRLYKGRQKLRKILEGLQERRIKNG